MCQGRPLLECLTRAIGEAHRLLVEPYMLVLTPQTYVSLESEVAASADFPYRTLGALGEPPTFRGIPIVVGHDDMVFTAPLKRICFSDKSSAWDIRDPWAGRWFPVHVEPHWSEAVDGVWKQIADQCVAVGEACAELFEAKGGPEKVGGG